MIDSGPLAGKLPAAPAYIRPVASRLERATPFVKHLGELQRRLCILHALRWDESTEQDFFAHQARELPCVTQAWYTTRPLPFVPATISAQLADLAHAVATNLGSKDPIALLLSARLDEARKVVAFLAARGTSAFTRRSVDLFGTTRHQDALTGRLLVELAPYLHHLCPPQSSSCSKADHSDPTEKTEKADAGGASLDASTTARQLADRLVAYFGEPIPVHVTGQLSADAVARGKLLKLRANARFQVRDLNWLEVHEGWVHLGTTLNASYQPLRALFARPLPAGMCTQEGLAVLTEILTGASHPARLQRLGWRIEAIACAEAGADFLDVYHWFLERGLSAHESYQASARIFRGSLPQGGPCTKDLIYGRGLLEVMQLGLAGQPLSLLFCGKTCSADLPLLQILNIIEIVATPRFLPPPFVDAQQLRVVLRGLSDRLCELCGFHGLCGK